MNSNITEQYQPRAVSDLGVWDVGNLQFKVNGIVADGRDLAEITVADAYSFVSDEVLLLLSQRATITA